MRDEDEFIIGPPNKLMLNLRELWDFRELFYFFSWRDIKVKYKQATLGILWVVLQPVLMMLIFTLFFGQIPGIQPEGIPYSVFTFSGLVFWNFFASCVTNAGNAMVSNASVIKKIYFPRLIIPVSAVLSASVDLLITWLLFIIYLFIKQVPLSSSLFFYWPLAFLLTLSATIGLGCWLSALMVKYRDFRFIVPFAIQIGFFVTPVVYPVSRITLPYVKYLVALNPMYGAINLFRQPIMPQTLLDMPLMIISIVSSVSLLIVGILYFKKTELFFADLA
ncbi:MAG TPA: ABC transporter permease [Ohtaekwangia sp.]